MADEKVLTYKGYPLIRKDKLTYLGSMSDDYIIQMQILDTATVDGEEVASKVSVELLRTDPSLRAKDRIVKRSEKEGFFTALDVGYVWLNRALNPK